MGRTGQKSSFSGTFWIFSTNERNRYSLVQNILETLCSVHTSELFGWQALQLLCERQGSSSLVPQTAYLPGSALLGFGMTLEPATDRTSPPSKTGYTLALWLSGDILALCLKLDSLQGVLEYISWVWVAACNISARQSWSDSWVASEERESTGLLCIKTQIVSSPPTYRTIV